MPHERVGSTSEEAVQAQPTAAQETASAQPPLAKTLDPAAALRLQRAAGNAAVARLVAGQPPPPAAPRPHGPPALPAQRVQREPYPVIPEMAESDKTRNWYDPADKTVKPVWTSEGGYTKNPSARKLSDLVTPKGRIGGGFDNGVYTYVVDKNGDVIVAKRLSEPGGRPGRATGMPHPTLIGGKDPTVLAAGEVEIRGGKIYRIDNQSGHFRPPRKTLSTSLKSFMKLPTQVFDPRFKAESVHYDAAGTRTTKAFRSLRTLKLTARDFKSALKGLKPKAVMGKLKGLGKRFKGRMTGSAKGIAGLIVVVAVHFFLSKWMEEITEDFMQRQIEELAPVIERKLLEKEDELDALLAEDSEADFYINVRFGITTITTTTFAGPDGPEQVDSLPLVELESVGFSRQPWDPKEINRFEHECGASSHTTIVTVSHPVSPAELFEDVESTDTEGAPEPVPQ
jgi:hypothetical protein